MCAGKTFKETLGCKNPSLKKWCLLKAGFLQTDEQHRCWGLLWGKCCCSTDYRWCRFKAGKAPLLIPELLAAAHTSHSVKVSKYSSIPPRSKAPASGEQCCCVLHYYSKGNQQKWTVVSGAAAGVPVLLCRGVHAVMERRRINVQFLRLSLIYI